MEYLMKNFANTNGVYANRRDISHRKKVVKMKKYFASFEGFSKGYNGWVIYYSTLKKSNLGDYIASNGYRTDTFFDTLEECINSVSEIRNSGIYNFIELL